MTIVAPPVGALLLGVLPMQGVLAIDVVTALLAVAISLRHCDPAAAPSGRGRGEVRLVLVGDACGPALHVGLARSDGDPGHGDGHQLLPHRGTVAHAHSGHEALWRRGHTPGRTWVRFRHRRTRGRDGPGRVGRIRSPHSDLAHGVGRHWTWLPAPGPDTRPPCSGWRSRPRSWRP